MSVVDRRKQRLAVDVRLQKQAELVVYRRPIELIRYRAKTSEHSVCSARADHPLNY